MEYSEKFNDVNDFYKQNLWNANRVRNAVIKKWITEEEFYIITGKTY